jgi:hypothetical protein
MWGTLNAAEVRVICCLKIKWLNRGIMHVDVRRNAYRRKAMCFVCVINFPNNEVIIGDAV